MLRHLFFVLNHKGGGKINSEIYSAKELREMTQSKGQKQRQWDIRKESQNEHGKVKSFKELEQEGTQKKQ